MLIPIGSIKSGFVLEATSRYTANKFVQNNSRRMAYQTFMKTDKLVVY